MMLLTSSTALRETLADCLDRSSEVYIAAAWLRDGFSLQQLIKSKCRFQAVIGTDFGMTDPDSVKRLWKSSDRADVVRLFPATGNTFHPKLYLFKTSDGWESLVGSANMTAAAFADNYEAMAHLRLTAQEWAEWLDAWRSWWAECPRLTTARLTEYSREAAKWARVALTQLSQRADLTSRSPKPNALAPKKRIASAPRLIDVLSVGFVDYVNLLRNSLKGNGMGADSLDAADRGYSNYLSVIERAHAILEADGFPDPNDPDRFAIVLGTRKDTGWLGSMKGLRSGWSALKRPQFVESLRSRVRPLLHATGTADLIRGGREVFELVTAQQGVAHGVATRVLALARPDQFLSVNQQSVDKLAAFFGVRAADLKTWQGYERTLRLLWKDAEWFRSAEPADAHMARLWRARVAIIDAIAYTPRSL
jgi:hypothetical protein